MGGRVGRSSGALSKRRMLARTRAELTRHEGSALPRVRCGITSTRLSGVSLSTCVWPLGRVIVEGELISVGPALDAFVVALSLAVVLLLVLPPVGLIAMLVILVTYLAVPRWQSAKGELGVRPDYVLGALRGFTFHNRSNDSSVGVWLPRDSRLTKLLADQGVALEQSG